MSGMYFAATETANEILFKTWKGDTPEKYWGSFVAVSLFAVAFEFVKHTARPAAQRYLRREPRADASTGTARVAIHVQGMTCSSCVASIEHGVGGRTGVGKVTVSLDEELVEIEYDPCQDEPTGLLNAISDLGFTPYTKRAVIHLPTAARCVDAGLFMVQLTLGYFLMLVAMVYNVGLFLACILGAGLGYFVFAPWKGETTGGGGGGVGGALRMFSRAEHQDPAGTVQAPPSPSPAKTSSLSM